ncbi:hypothetical protein CAPTEDRAFT_167084 [Capitella teleta]|uniref:TEPP protein n=1 Tax=Capitella teleta TaxID=283909 RepID=R7U7U0_CAPTE|nr:hypothetical protein CAPTEDRAFT_167084 [Capitella teleta]|eukprot:ELU02034.1 hypothetical protein CAPTEDRAFT_167084 [Capitella teleta]
MTTIGVQPPPSRRLVPLDIPSYVYNYPSNQRVRLAAVKSGLFHPNLPSFRRMDMDTARHRLPEEHCRTSTSCGPEDFKWATTSVMAPPANGLHCADITETGKTLHKYYSAPEELRNTQVDWHEFLQRCPERYKIRLPELPENKNLHVYGYNVRYLRPEITSSWKYTLRQEPSLDQFGQKPIPANVFARYRDTVPKYSRNISAEAWR